MGSKDQRMSSRRNVQYLLMILIGMCCCTGNIHAQETDTVEIVVPPVEDTAYTDEEEEETTVEVEQPVDTMLVMNSWMYPADSLRKIKQQKEFSYIKNLDSLLKARQEAYLKSKKEMEEEEKVQPPDMLPVVRFLLWTIAITAVLFIIYRLFLSERGLFSAPTKNKKTEIEEEVVVDEEYLTQQLKEAIRNKNYRLAIRYLYLQSLSKMADKEWLVLSPDKTNDQYVRELNKAQHKNEFARVTLYYEYAWYGDFVIADEVFTSVQKEIELFQQKIK
ncbi:MAG: DUF4129 domain-containing protein [Chitinophagaceae bacterium]|nr:DUF4129 domain-containing protein [Chitinophagaceae bacterium]